MNDIRDDRPSDRPGDEPMGADERLAQDALKALPRARADRAFRERLKADFASGAIESAIENAAEPARDTERVTPLRPVPRPFPWSGGRGLGWRTTVAIAAAIIAVVLFGNFNQGPAWRVTAVRGEGAILVGGTPLRATDVAAIGNKSPAGVQIEVPRNTELELRAGSVMAMQAISGTTLVLPPTPPRWFGRRTALHVMEGEVRMTTGPAFRGATLTITTPDASAMVVGTTFAVILEPSGTCVCVYEGTVMVGPHDAPPAPIPSGMRRYVFHDGRPPEDAGIRVGEQDLLGEFRAKQMAAMGVK